MCKSVYVDLNLDEINKQDFIKSLHIFILSELDDNLFFYNITQCINAYLFYIYFTHHGGQGGWSCQKSSASLTFDLSVDQ